MFLASLSTLGATDSSWSDIIDSSTKVEKVVGDLKFTEGPVWFKDGSLVFSDIPADTLYSWKDGKLAVFLKPSQNANGNTLDRQGRLVSCHHGSRSVTRIEKDGKVVTLADSYEGKKLNSPNDLAIRSTGDIYFSDPPYGIRKDQEELGFYGVYRIDPKGALHLLLKDFVKPNGLVFSPDEKVLYIADTDKAHVRAFNVAKDGTLSGDRVFCSVKNPDGMRMDVHGNLFVAALDGVRVYAPSGEGLGVISVPEQPANLAFAEDGHTLYITARTGLYKVRLKTKGIIP